MCVCVCVCVSSILCVCVCVIEGDDSVYIVTFSLLVHVQYGTSIGVSMCASSVCMPSTVSMSLSISSVSNTTQQPMMSKDTSLFRTI